MSVNVVLRQDQTQRRLVALWRHFTKFNCCSPQLIKRRRYNAEAKIGDSFVAPDVRMEEVVIGSSFEVVIGSSLKVMISSSLEMAINDLLEVAINNSLEAAINEITPSDELPIFPSDELPIFPSDELPIFPSDELPISPLDELLFLPLDKLPIFPSDELPIKNNKLKNRNSRNKYRERRKKKRLAAACLALQMAGNPTSDPDNNPPAMMSVTEVALPTEMEVALIIKVEAGVERAKARVEGSNVDRKRKKLVKGRLMNMITGEVVRSAAVVAAAEDVVVDDDDATKKCKEAGGAQDSIDDDDDDDDDDRDNFDAGDRDHEVHCTIQNDEVSIVPDEDIDILTKKKNSGDKIEYKNLGGNIWLKQLCQDKVEEYCNTVGKRAYTRKDIFLTTIINQLANENRRVLQIRNGEWAQLKEPEVRRNILAVMGNAKRKMNIMAPVVPVIKNKFWKDSEEKRLRDWYIKKTLTFHRFILRILRTLERRWVVVELRANLI